MARVIERDKTEMFRAVVTQTHEDGLVHERYYGPYLSAGVARGVATTMRWPTRGWTTTTRVEKSTLNWEPVD